MTDKKALVPSVGEFLVFVGDDGTAQVHVRIADGTVWLTQGQLAGLYGKDRIVVMYLDYAEEQARKRRPMTMSDWIAKLDGFLQFNERNILTHAGTVSQALAAVHAEAEFERYDAERRRLEAEAPSSDFDRLVEASDNLSGEAPRKPVRGKKP